MRLGILNWRQWSIKSRMAFIALVQMALMFSLNTIYSYYSRLNEAYQEVNERGLLLATLLAESSDYDVATSNVSQIEKIIQGLIKADKSVKSIEILNKNKDRLIKQSRNVPNIIESRFSEVPIKGQIVSVPSLTDLNTPHLSSSNSEAQIIPPPIVGYVIVEMTPTEMIEKQHQRTFIQVIISILVLLLSAGLTLVLASSLIKPLAKTIKVVRDIRQGNYIINLEVTTGGEIAELQCAIVEMAKSLDEYKRNLEEKVNLRTKALKVARDDAVKSNIEKQQLIKKINTAVEEERKIISIEIHDQLNSTLIGIRLEAHQILDSLKNNEQLNSDNIAARINTIISHASELYAMAREIVRRLRPEVIDALGLPGAVEDMVDNFDRLHKECQFVYEEAGDFSALDDDIAITAYRLVQEALSNTVKHSEAKNVNVTLQALIRNKERTLKMTISDDGKGFNPTKIEPGIGLIGMRERVYGFDGQLAIQSSVNNGTKIIIELPFKKIGPHTETSLEG